MHHKLLRYLLLGGSQDFSWAGLLHKGYGAKIGWVDVLFQFDDDLLRECLTW